MNCEQIRDAILNADDPFEAACDATTEVGQHVLGCEDCRAFAARLTRIEKLAAKLPTPGSDVARQYVLAGPRNAEAAMPTRRRFFLRPAFLSAAAALLIIGVGVALYLRPTEKPTSVVEQLIDWDVSIADAQGPQERQQIYASLAPKMQSAVQSAVLSDDDRRLATRLLENGASLSRGDADPVERAERFCDLNDILVGRIDSAASRNDAMAVQRLGPKYAQMQQNLTTHLDRLHAIASTIPPERTRRLASIAKRTADAEKRLQVVSEQAERASQKALRRTLEQTRNKGRRGAI